MAVYVAEQLTAGRAMPEADESIHIRFFPLAPLARKAAAGKLQDGKTISAILAYALQTRIR